MKTYRRVSLVLLIVGILLCCVGIGMGGHQKLMSSASSLNRYLVFNFEKGESFTKELELPSNSNLSIKVEGVNSNIEYYDGTTIKVETNNVSSEYDFSSANNEINMEFEGCTNLSSRSKVVIYIPKDYMFNNVNITVEASDFKFDSLKCNQFIYDSDAGNLKAEDLECTGKVSLEGDAASIDISLISCNGLDLDMNAGNIKTVLAGNRDDYCINKDADVSTVTIENEHHGENHGSKIVNVDCDAGNVEIKFKGE
ncbi:MAG: DUF4097 family beta strand repeat-containing protein [Thomasclavelia sp.]|jgi:hypothetical protein|nr:DUF4097 family beta strand repeat-containing protein [Thomasclavelia sp.]